MTQNSLPTLSLHLLDRLRKQSDENLELPPESLLSAPETILQMGWGKFMRGFVPDFVQCANADGRYCGRIIAVQRKPDYRSEASARQDTLYTLVLRGVDCGLLREVKRIVASVSRLLIADQDWDEVAAAARKREIRVVLSNATETGLKLDVADSIECKPR
jgi:tagaturonate reductase